MSRLRPLVAVTLALAAGIVFALGASAPPPLPFLLLAAIVTLIVGSRIPRGPLFLAAFAVVGMLLGQAAGQAARTDCRTHLPEGAPLVVRGALVAHVSDDGVGRVRLETVGSDSISVPCRGVVRVRIRGRAGNAPPPGVPFLARGTWRVWPVEGRWPRPPDRLGTLTIDSIAGDGPTGHPARAADGASVEAPTSASISTSSPSDPRASIHLVRTVERLRGKAQARIRAMHGERAATVEALILAQRDGFDPAVRDRFVRAGLAHLLAISGMHVGLITGSLLLLGRIARLSTRTSAWAAALLTVGYVLILGAPYAASRAALQVVLLLASRLLQRPADPLAILATAALVILAFDPLAILDPGFQLSFAGVAGIVLLRRRLIEAVPLTGRWRTWWEGTAVSIAATLSTTPIAALHFGQAAPIGILSNLVAIPLSALAVPALACTLLVGMISLEAGRFLAGGAGLLLAALDRTAAVAAAVPGGNVLVTPDTVLAWVLAAFLAAWSTRRLARVRAVRPLVRRAVATTAALALLVAWPLVAGGGRGGALEIHGIDVGQGDALAIRTPAGRWILVDTGPRGATYDAGRSRVVPYLLRHGVRRLEFVVLTHPDSDHIGGAAAVLESFAVGAVVDPGLPAGKAFYLDALRSANRDDVRWIAARPEMEVIVDDVVLRFLHPPEAKLDVADDANEVSVAFGLEYGAFRALFLGDAYSDAEQEMVERYGPEMRADLLKVGHHGSRTSTSETLLRAAKPRIAIVSAGRDNSYGHPHAVVVERLERHGVEIFRTDLHGSIRVRARPDGTAEVVTTR